MHNNSNRPLVCDYLLTHSLKQLNEEHGVKSSGQVGDSFFSVNYDQIESKPSPLVNQCRGMVLVSSSPLTEGQVSGEDPVGQTTVTGRGMDRFFNLGDPNADPVNMDSKEVVFAEKLDGNCCMLYFNNFLFSWEVATRSVPLADKSISGWGDWTFRKLFDKALEDTTGKTFSEFVSFLDTEVTYVFELTTPLNRIVVHYADYKVHLLALRNTQTGQEFVPEEVFPSGLFGVPLCPTHKLSNLEELLTFVGSKPPFEQEGVVVRDNKTFGRVKVKSLAYLAYNKVRDSSANSPRIVMELILAEKLDDVLPILDVMIQKEAVKLQEGMRVLIQKVDSQFSEIMSTLDMSGENPRKQFALGVQARNGWMPPLMDRFLGRCTGLGDWLRGKRDPSKNEWPTGLLDTLVDLCSKG